MNVICPLTSSVQYNCILSTIFILTLNLNSQTKELNGLIKDTKNLLFKTNEGHKLFEIFPFI